MKRRIFAALSILFIVASFAAWTDAGFNFRATSGYVTDGTNETYVLATDSYPTTRGGFTFGYVGTPGESRDRDSGVDRRLAGIHQADNATAQYTFRVDLTSAGSYNVSIANGDTGTGQAQQLFIIKDAATTEATCNDAGGTSVDNYNDATCNNRAEAVIFSSQAKLTATFGDSACADEGNGAGISCLYLSFGVNSGGATGSSTIAHMRIESNGPTPTPSPTPSPTASPTPVPGTGGNVYPLLRRMKEQHD